MRIVAVGAYEDQLNDLPFEVHSWSEATEVNEIQQFDIGIMPLPDEPFERGKCGYKLIQYMACGKPVIASPVGANRTIVMDGISGYFATSVDDWLRTFRKLLSSETRQFDMGAYGR